MSHNVSTLYQFFLIACARYALFFFHNMYIITPFSHKLCSSYTSLQPRWTFYPLLFTNCARYTRLLSQNLRTVDAPVFRNLCTYMHYMCTLYTTKCLCIYSGSNFVKDNNSSSLVDGYFSDCFAHRRFKL